MKNCLTMMKVFKYLPYNWEDVKILLGIEIKKKGIITSVSFSSGLLSLFSGICKTFSILFFIK